METRRLTSATPDPHPPAGVHAFLIADLRGYTRFTDESGDEAAASVTQRFVALATEVFSGGTGRIVEVRGDEILAVFASPREAVRSAVSLQSQMRGARDSMPLQAGIGIDAGEAVPVNGGYRGRALNMAARLCGRAKAGEVLITPEVAHLVGAVDGLAFEDRGPVRLKGLTRPIHLNAVVPTDTTPPRGGPEGHKAVELRVLGPLEVLSGGQAVSLGGPRQRLVLAQLLLDTNHVVSMPRLIEGVWGDEPPAAARNTIQGYVSHLRNAIGPERIEGRAPGYVLHTEHEEVDFVRFERLLRRARRHLQSDPAQAVASFEEALSLWRGTPLSDLADYPSLTGEISRLEDLRLAALEDLFGARLAQGEHAQVAGELERLTKAHPLRERMWGLLILALYRSGRQGEALDAYGRARSLLAEELGIDPSSELRDLHQRILRQDPTLELQGRPLRSYRLLEQIGEGGYGLVWRAYDPGVGREVAIKQIHVHLADDPAFVRSFEREAQMVARIEHPHVVPLYDYWRDGTGAYLVMRLMRGGNLVERLESGPMRPELTAELLGQVASALSFAHRQGLVHRDVKPENVLLDEEGNAYLSDFGIAKDRQEDGGPVSHTTDHGYRSPEQTQGRPATPLSDIYALGMLLAAMVPQPRPEAVESVINRAIATEPESRYGDARQLADELRSAIEGAVPAEPSPEAQPSRNPFKGLRPFSEADAEDFFGRDSLIQKLVARLSEPAAPRFLAVVGPSGSGKSSVVRAGLLPALRAGAIPGSERWFYTDLLPGPRPMEELESALIRVAAEPPGSLIDELESDEKGIVRAVERVLPGEDSELLLVVDQFEEIFTLVNEEGTRARVLESLVEAVADPESRVRVVVTLRADFYDRPLAYQGLAELVQARTQTVIPLTAEELERAIAGPAERVGVIPERSLVAEIVADVTDQPSALPLMQYALTETFERRRGPTLTLEAYRDAGGVAGALSRRAEQLFSGMNEVGKEAARQLFLRLVAIGEGAEDTRRLVPRAELASLEVDQEAMDAVIDTFGRRRLLSFDRDPETRGPTVEVAHEALLREWGRLRGWIDAAREDIVMHRRLSSEADDWERAGRDPSFLLRGSRLTQFEAWSDTTGLALSEDEREFLHESLRSREEERKQEEARTERERALERRSVVRMRVLVGVLAAAALVASLLTLVAVGQRGSAQRAERVATARELATASVANLEVDPQLSLLLGLQAVDTTREDGTVLPEAVVALHRAVAADREILEIRNLPSGLSAFSPDGRLLITQGLVDTPAADDLLLWDARTGERLRSIDAGVESASELIYSPEGTRVAMLTTDSRIIIWDTGSWDQTRTVSLRGREVSEASGLAFSPDGQLLAAAGGDGIVSIVEADTAKEIRRMRVPGGAFLGVTFSPDGTRVTAMPNFGGDIPVWDVATGRQLLSLPATGGSLDADYSPDGDEIATVNSEAGIEIWNAHEGGDPIRILEGHTGPVWGVEYSPDGTLLASAGDDGTARLWDTTTGKQVMALHGHSGTVFGVRFTPDGTRVLTAGSDGTLRLWDISPSGSREFLTLGHASEVSGVEYSPDGSRLLTLDNHAYARLWDASTGQVLGGAADVGEFQPDFSPDGSSFSAPSWAPAIRDSNTGRVLQNLPLSQGDWLLATAYSPDGSMIAGSLGDTAAPGTVLVWDASTGDQLRQLGQLASEYEAVKDLAYSPDGTVLAGMERTGLVRFWDAQSGDEVGTFKAQSANGTTVTFSRDGSLLATAGADGAILWDMPSGRKLMTLTGHSSAVADVAFSHDGRLVATVGQDQTARVWDVDTGREVITLYGHTAPLTGVAFSPDGTKLATSSFDGTARVYLLQTNDIIRLARSRLLRGFTDSECRQYLHLDSCPPSMAPAPAGPAPAASEPLGPEGAFRMTVTAKDLLGAGFPRKDVKYNVGDWTLSMSAGRFRLHQNHPSGYPWETSGSYVVEDGRIIFTDEDPGCFSTAISTRWRLRDQTLSFADTEELTPCGATGDYLATLGTLFESQDWSRVP